MLYSGSKIKDKKGNIMKKILWILSAFCLLFVVVGCMENDAECRNELPFLLLFEP